MTKGNVITCELLHLLTRLSRAVKRKSGPTGRKTQKIVRFLGLLLHNLHSMTLQKIIQQF